jgi:hypothetical protein
MSLGKRQFLIGGLPIGLGLSFSATLQAQQGSQVRTGGAGNPFRRPPPPTRQARTIVLFQSPEGHPNAIASDEHGRGLWIAEEQSNPDRTNCNAYLVDWKGSVLKKIATPGANTSGMAQGGGFLWMGSDGRGQEHSGIYQIDIESGDIVAKHQHPLSPSLSSITSSTHGIAWDDDHKKLWVSVDRLDVLMRIDPASWTPDLAFRLDTTYFARHHGIGYDKGFIWDASYKSDPTTGKSSGHTEGHGGLARYDATSGETVLNVDFVTGSADPHAVTVHGGVIYCCDSGLHPGWPDNDSPTTGAIFRVELI